MGRPFFAVHKPWRKRQLRGDIDHRPIFLDDIALQAHQMGSHISATIRGDRVALLGTRSMARVPSGLNVHALDATAETAFETRASRAAGLMFHIVLEGPVHAWVDETELQLGCVRDQSVKIAYSASAGPAAFRRSARKGDYLRKVNISASWEWLADRGIAATDILGQDTFRQSSWAATPDEVAAAERLVAISSDPQREVERELLAFTLFGRALTHLLGAGLNGPDHDRLARMEALGTTPGPMPSLSDIATAGGMSISAMQRLFHKVYEVSAMAHLRQLRLKRASNQLREGISVAQAAHDAGYVSAEAFATAFRRAFGIAPSELLRQPDNAEKSRKSANAPKETP